MRDHAETGCPERLYDSGDNGEFVGQKRFSFSSKTGCYVCMLQIRPLSLASLNEPRNSNPKFKPVTRCEKRILTSAAKGLLPQNS